jgi:hypothetical protein
MEISFALMEEFMLKSGYIDLCAAAAKYRAMPANLLPIIINIYPTAPIFIQIIIKNYPSYILTLSAYSLILLTTVS